ncbi:MAG: helix-turn-helix domain-containing protein [Candidatus Micrarchaeota archaeon]
MTDPLIVTVEYNHDCICSDVPERHPDTRIRYLAELGSSDNRISHLFNIRGGDLARFIDSLRRHATAVDVKVLRKDGKRADIITITKEDASTHHALNISGCAFITTPVYDSGIERARLFAPSFDSLKQFLDSLKNSYNVKVASKHYLKETERICTEEHLKSGYMEFISATDMLTERQMEALRLASRLRYYDVPKQSTLKDIGERMGISDAAAGELLRKAQKKLLPVFAKIAELQN